MWQWRKEGLTSEQILANCRTLFPQNHARPGDVYNEVLKDCGDDLQRIGERIKEEVGSSFECTNLRTCSTTRARTSCS